MRASALRPCETQWFRPISEFEKPALCLFFHGVFVSQLEPLGLLRQPAQIEMQEMGGLPKVIDRLDALSFYKNGEQKILISTRDNEFYLTESLLAPAVTIRKFMLHGVGNVSERYGKIGAILRFYNITPINSFLKLDEMLGPSVLTFFAHCEFPIKEFEIFQAFRFWFEPSLLDLFGDFGTVAEGVSAEPVLPFDPTPSEQREVA